MSQHTVITRRRLAAWLAAAAALPFVPGPRAGAQEAYPSKVVRFLVPWAPGGVTDVTARLLARQMAIELDQSVIVENRSGASGTLGHAVAARAPADGYTVLIGTNSTYAIAPSLMEGLTYDSATAFAPVGLMLRTPQMLCVHPSVPAKTVAELVDHVRSRPAGQVTFASAGPGSTSHLATELFMSLAGIEMNHIPYRGGGPAQQALIAGEVNVCFVDAVIALTSSEAGQLNILGVSTGERLALAPNVPAIAETLPGFQSTTDVAMFVPAGTPAPIIERLHAAMTASLKADDFAKPLLKQGAILVGGPPQEFPPYLEEETSKWRRLIEARKISVR